MPRPHKRPAPRRPPRTRIFLRVLAAGLLAAAAAGALLWHAGRLALRSPLPVRTPASPSPLNPAPKSDAQIFASYGGSESCRECHQEEYALWKPSHHALAERPIDAALDRTAFDPGRGFHHGSQTTDLRWSNGAPQIISAGLSGRPESLSVARVIGADPLRQFLTAFPGGRFQALEASYDPHSNQWFNVYGEEDRKPGEWGHWTGRGMNWNYMCASCHNTRLRRNYDPSTDSYHTTLAEQSVGCESCHGPLKAHNDWQKQFGRSGKKDPTVGKFSREQVLDYCGFCHARRDELTGDFQPGDRFSDAFNLATVDHSDRYYSDGQIRAEDYEYGSFLGSRMHLKGVYCTDCHNPHSYKTILPGNWLCLRCHDGSNTNAPQINPATHSHHLVYGFDTNGQPRSVDLTAYRPDQVKETGGQCVNCHMPQTVYMQRHWRHDHGFTSPDPLLTLRYGIPNACNRCHTDKDADWSLKYCDAWYGAKMDRPARRRAEVVEMSRAQNPGAPGKLMEMFAGEDSPYWRAVALDLLALDAGRPEVKQTLLRGLNDTNELVRAAAARALEFALPGDAGTAADALRLRLSDPVRAVRIAAAWSLRASLDPHSLPGTELERFLGNKADQPVGQLQLAIYALSRKDFVSAEKYFRQAIAWDPNSPPFYHQLAAMYSELNRPRDAVTTLEEACRHSPRDAESHFQLGLACNEAGDLPRAKDELAETVQLDPRHASAWYNLGLAQNSLGLSRQALDSLLRAESVTPEVARIPYARATILAQLGRKSEAAAAARRALEINPSFQQARELLDMLGP